MIAEFGRSQSGVFVLPASHPPAFWFLVFARRFQSADGGMGSLSLCVESLVICDKHHYVAKMVAWPWAARRRRETSVARPWAALGRKCCCLWCGMSVAHGFASLDSEAGQAPEEARVGWEAWACQVILSGKWAFGQQGPKSNVNHDSHIIPPAPAPRLIINGLNLLTPCFPRKEISSRGMAVRRDGQSPTSQASPHVA
jgi:hypothetical protein